MHLLSVSLPVLLEAEDLREAALTSVDTGVIFDRLRNAIYHHI